jgi:hypothetical protein
LITNSHSIRDVIYFPLLRHEVRQGAGEVDEDSSET